VDKIALYKKGFKGKLFAPTERRADEPKIYFAEY